MKDETPRAEARDGASQTEEVQPEDLMPYHKPALQHFGSLAELVQVNPGTGADGAVLPDCTHS